MPTNFLYQISVSKSEGGKREPLLSFGTQQIDITPEWAQRWKILNEVQAGILFTQITNLQRFSVVVPEEVNPRVVHALHVIPLNRPMLEVSISLERVTGDTSGVRFFTVMTFTFPMVTLLSIQATKDESYMANFKYDGYSQQIYYDERSEG
jgi:hypothetical protein